MGKAIDRRAFIKCGALTGALIGPGVRGSASAAGIAAASPQAVTGRQLDSRDFSLAVYAGLAPSMAFDATDRRGAQMWQRRVNVKLAEVLGGFPSARVDLRPEVLERKDLGHYTREKIVFQTRTNLSAVGYLLMPEERPARLPALICLPGHGRGVAEVIGLAEDGTDRSFAASDVKPMAIQAVEHGYATFALEQLGFGERRDPASRARGPQAYSCQPAASAALLMGQTMAGWRVWDVMRTIDYLTTRTEIDASRIGAIGVSGGGTTSLFATAMEPRIKVGIVSAYFNTFRDSIVSLSHCVCNYVPRILEYVEMSDLAGLVAPRFLFAEAGARDRIFPVAGARAACERAQTIYQAFGVPDHFGYDIWDGEHGFSGVEAFRFLRARL